MFSPQEYEERLAKLQAEYNAEQESKAKLQEDIAALCSAYESKLSHLEKSRASRGSSVLKNGKPSASKKEQGKEFVQCLLKSSIKSILQRNLNKIEHLEGCFISATFEYFYFLCTNS